MKFGILGAGKIAQVMAGTTRKMDEVENYAIGARDLERAQAFAKEYGFTKAYGSYEELLSDKQVELIYIAVPHSHHYEVIKQCLEHGKHVLCEKAFTVNAQQAKEVLELAREKNLLLTEAIWTRYIPMRGILDDLIASGIIGSIHSVMADLCYPLSDIERNKKPELAGGALLDIGIYTLNFACMVCQKEITDVQAHAVMNEYGVDDADSITLTFEDGTLAVLHSDQRVSSNRGAVICGETGYIEVDNVNNVQGCRVYNQEYELLKEIKAPDQITGYEYEVEACRKAILSGEIQCPEMPHEETLRMMELMDRIRGIWGLVYPMEG